MVFPLVCIRPITRPAPWGAEHKDGADDDPSMPSTTAVLLFPRESAAHAALHPDVDGLLAAAVPGLCGAGASDGLPDNLRAAQGRGLRGIRQTATASDGRVTSTTGDVPRGAGARLVGETHECVECSVRPLPLEHVEGLGDVEHLAAVSGDQFRGQLHGGSETLDVLDDDLPEDVEGHVSFLSNQPPFAEEAVVTNNDNVLARGGFRREKRPVGNPGGPPARAEPTDRPRLGADWLSGHPTGFVPSNPRDILRPNHG